MVYQVVAAVLLLVAVGSLFVAGKVLLAGRKWIAGFLQGCLCVSLLVVVVVLALAARDVSSYRTAAVDVPVATLSFRKKVGNEYAVELHEVGGAVYSRDVMGQQWELSSRMLKWSPIMGALGFRTGYRFDSLRGRYLELQMDRAMAAEQPSPVLNQSEDLDVWKFLAAHGAALLGVEAYMSTPGFIPIADGAIFDIVLAGTHFSARPMNDAAKNAASSW